MSSAAANLEQESTTNHHHVVFVGTNREQTTALWLRSAIDESLAATQRFLRSVEVKWPRYQAFRRRSVLQSGIRQWKQQNSPPGCFVIPNDAENGVPVEVPDETVEAYLWHYFMARHTAALRNHAIATAKKIRTAWESRAFRSKLQETYRCELRSCFLDMRHHWWDPLISDDLEANHGRIINLEPLRALFAHGLAWDSNTHAPKDHFFPSSIYVRREMPGIFQLFCRDVGLLLNHEDEAISRSETAIVWPWTMATAFMGSSGVGKSILFFLAALYRSQNSVTMFIRQSPISGEYMSVFIMFPNPDAAGTVQVLYSRHWDDTRVHVTNDLTGLIIFLEENLQLEREEYYIFLDGAEYSQYRPHDTLNGRFDFLCTSEGYPLPKSEQYGSARKWIMSGWTPEDAEAAFVHLHSDTEEIRSKARQVYALCGGTMRSMRRAFDNPKRSRELLICRVHNLDGRQYCLYSSATVTVDPILTLFREDLEKFDGRCVQQYVDSKFVWRILARKLDLVRLVENYKYSIETTNLAVARWHFESIVLAWFFEHVWRQKDSIIQTVSNVEAITDKNDGPLIPKKHQYWVPHSLTFRNIDSAVVINNTLYAFVVTVEKESEFEALTFFHDFCGTMQEFSITSVTVCVLTTKPDFAISMFCDKVKEEVQLDSTFPDDWKRFVDMTRVPRDCWMQVVNMNNVECFRESMKDVLSAIHHFEERKRKTPTAAISGMSSE